MSKTQLAEKQETNVVPVASGMLGMIERAATDPNVDVEKMERLYEMHQKMQASEAQKSFNLAMTRAQMDMSPISADASNPQTHSKYASYNQLDKALRPIYTKHGFSLSFDTSESSKESHVRVLCHVSHGDGHTRTYQADMPADGKGAKGNDVMTKTHASGAAMTYGMRYLLKLIFNVAIGEQDTDGNMPDPVVNEEQAANLQSLIDEVGEEGKKALFDWLKISSVDQVPVKSYKQAVAGLEKRRK